MMLPVLLTALLFSADPAAPATEAASEPAAKTEKKKVQKICRTEAMVTGSHRPRRTCLSKEEWARRDGNASGEDHKAMGSH